MTKLRQQMKDMTPEQREAFRKKLREQRGPRPDTSAGDMQK